MNGAPGPTGPTGGSITVPVSVHSTVLAVGRAMSGDLLTATAECDPGEVVIAGGVVPTIAGGLPQDIQRIHELFSGPTSPTAWTAASTTVNTLSQTANLTYTVYALCIPAPDVL